MGLDIGEKRIGIAISDEEKKISLPHRVLKNDSRMKAELENIIDSMDIEKIIVGMPYTLKGDIGMQGKKTIGFVKENILDSGREVIYQDERFTSTLPSGIPAGKKARKDLDKYSAALILQAYLDRTWKINRVQDDE